MTLQVISRLSLSSQARIAVGAVFATLVVLASGLVSGSAGAQTITPGTSAKDAQTTDQRAYSCCWGALKMAKDGKYGYSYEYNTKRAAWRRAGRACNRRSPYVCRRVAATHDSWLAVAVKWRPNGLVAHWGAAAGYRTKRGAYRRALNECRSLGRPCHKHVAVFSGR